MHMFDLFSEEDFTAARADKLINIRESGEGLLIYNYSDSAMYTPGAWDNPAVRICRGLITTEDGTVLARPYAKFFNYGQPGADEISMDEPVEVTDKADGSLGILHLTPADHVRVATRGSFSSDQAIWATEWVNSNDCLGRLPDGFTPLAEIVYPENRIVLNYGNFEGLILLGGVWNETGEYVGPEEAARLLEWDGRVTEVFTYTSLREALESPPRPNAEGLVVRAGNRILKLKQEDYILLHRIVTGLSERSVWQHMSEGKDLSDLLGPLPDELHDWVRGVWEDLHSSFIAKVDDVEHLYSMVEMFLRDADPDRLLTRGDWAQEFKKYPDITPLLFMRLDNRDLFPAIMKSLKPQGMTKPKTFSEDTA